MNSNYYSLDTYKQLKKKTRDSLLLSIGLYLLGIAILFISGFFITPKNVTILKIIDIVLVSISFLFATYFLADVHFPTLKREKFLFHLLTINRYEGLITIQKISEPFYLRKNVSVYEIEALDEDKKIINVYLESLHNIDFEIGETVKVQLANNYIVLMEKSK